MRLTDQGLVAVTAARQAAAERGGDPTAGDLLAGLAAEAEGQAGVLLRGHPSAAGRLIERVVAGAPDLPALEAVLASTVLARTEGDPTHAIPTRALLTGVLEAGGTGVVELLAACGYDPAQLYREATAEPATGEETFGLGSDPDLEPDAAAAVARVRATAGGAVDLVVAIARTPAGDRLLASDADELAVLRSTLRQTASSVGWDLGLDVVLDALRAWRRPPLTVEDLLRAAVAAGGHGPRLLVEEAARLTAEGEA